MAEEEQQGEGKNKRLRPQEQARGQKNEYVHRKNRI